MAFRPPVGKQPVTRSNAVLVRRIIGIGPPMAEDNAKASPIAPLSIPLLLRKNATNELKFLLEDAEVMLSRCTGFDLQKFRAGIVKATRDEGSEDYTVYSLKRFWLVSLNEAIPKGVQVEHRIRLETNAQHFYIYPMT